MTNVFVFANLSQFNSQIKKKISCKFQPFSHGLLELSFSIVSKFIKKGKEETHMNMRRD